MILNDKIRSMALETIILLAVFKLKWNTEYAHKISKEYRKYLHLCLMFPDSPIVPAKPVDDFWHMHITDTAKYEYDCDQIFGHKLDHFPYFGTRGVEDAQNLINAWEETLILYRHVFRGEADPVIWAEKVRCPSCGRRTEGMSEERPRLAIGNKPV